MLCHSKNPDAPLIECKIPGVSRVWCQFEDSHFATVPLPFPKVSGWDQREHDGGCNTLEGREDMVGGVYFSRSGGFKIWSLLDWASHMHC